MARSSQPSSFVVRAAADLAARLPAPLRALDLAMGSGRHALPLARLGFETFGVDRDLSRVRTAKYLAAIDGLALRVWVADLEVAPLPAGCFDLVVCARYLDRARMAAFAETLRPGGIFVFETFTTAQLAHGCGPKSPDHLLRPGEIAGLFPMLETIWSEEVNEPDAVARLIARRDGTARRRTYS